MTRKELESLGFVAITPETFPFDICTVQDEREPEVFKAPVLNPQEPLLGAYEVVLAIGDDMDNSPFDFMGLPSNLEVRLCHPYKFICKADGDDFPEDELVGAWQDAYCDNLQYHCYAFKFGRLLYSDEYKALMFRKVG